jgi:dynein heavy chain 1
LKEEAEVTQKRLEESTAALIVLEANLETLTNEYSVLVAHSEKIKSEMKVVKTKVDRSTSLLENLSSERTRWYHCPGLC